jgi:Zn-dependent peptidase ImmA (M78 family)
MKVGEIAAVIERKRAAHPELARALTWPGLLRICEREGVAIRMSSGRMPRPAQLVPFLGGWTIVLNRDTPYRRHTYLGTHELGHLWCHHDAKNERWERVFNMDEHWQADPREDDAEIFCSLVLMGPTRSRPYVPVTRGPTVTLDRMLETRLQFALRLARGNKPARRR